MFLRKVFSGMLIASLAIATLSSAKTFGKPFSGSAWLHTIVMNSDGTVIHDATVTLTNPQTDEKVVARSDGFEYTFETIPLPFFQHDCLLQVSAPGYERHARTIQWAKIASSYTVYLGRNGETYYNIDGVRIPYRVVPGILAISKHRLVETDERLVAKWDSLLTALKLSEVLGLADSLQTALGKHKAGFQWNCKFYRSNGQPLLSGKLDILATLRSHSDVVAFAGPVLSRGLSVANGCNFTFKPHKEAEGLQFLAAHGIMIVQNHWNSCYYPCGGILTPHLGTEVFEKLDALDASGVFESISPWMVQLYLEEE